MIYKMSIIYSLTIFNISRYKYILKYNINIMGFKPDSQSYNTVRKN